MCVFVCVFLCVHVREMHHFKRKIIQDYRFITMYLEAGVYLYETWSTGRKEKYNESTCYFHLFTKFLFYMMHWLPYLIQFNLSFLHLGVCFIFDFIYSYTSINIHMSLYLCISSDSCWAPLLCIWWFLSRVCVDYFQIFCTDGIGCW